MCVQPKLFRSIFLLLLGGAFPLFGFAAGGGGHGPEFEFPQALESYADTSDSTLMDTLKGRIAAEPFNLVASVIFLMAITHTFLTARIRHMAHDIEEMHAAQLKQRYRDLKTDNDEDGRPDEVSFKGQILHFLGEVEAVFGIWAIVLMVALTVEKGWDTVIGYIDHRVNYTEPMFVVVIMAMASSRPVLRFARQLMAGIASAGETVDCGLVVNYFDRGSRARFIHHGAGGDDDFGAVVGASVLRTQAVAEVCLCHDWPLVRKYISGGHVHAFCGSPGIDGGGSVGMGHALHVHPFRLESVDRNSDRDLDLLLYVPHRVRGHGGALEE